MDFSLPEEYVMLKQMVRKFTEKEMFPLEQTIINREAERGLSDTPVIPPEDEKRLLEKTNELGLWGIDVPEKFGGQELGYLAKVIVVEEMNRSIVPLTLPPDAPNLNYLLSCCNEQQYEKYLLPYARGEKISALAMTEPNAGTDAGGIQLRADRRGDKWVLNGSKMFISFAHKADFFITIAVSDREKGKRGGFTAFLVDKNTPGLTVVRNIPVIGEMVSYELVYDNVELDESQVLGEVGQAFIPLQNRFGVRRMELGARCCGLADRLIKLMIEQANIRTTFGKPLADRQAVQWWITNSMMDLHAARLMVYHAAWKADQGIKDLRLEAAMVKVFCTEMLTRIADRAIQVHGGLGLSKEMPIEYIYRLVRIFRIVEGPSEIHRWLVARELTRNNKVYDTFALER
ncbi:acyl-CoA dehydrogenase family protein [Desulfoscipio gibsoniae]|uniref:Medium-chain specific acyl-CoA dehydrogenase, mitochondrial n=1 Tax=Desulfoscipio gibsoniae DSM 7213 TaxID=767817 RepID=R4KEV4_9FIRM|nr:acyl-CoA dehydrogenase family protein [Desulfoscipio gibsoniae]AGL00202.1 acyl-CoA dehydrogenase [Desulfoscipio gibsoniae DSM 7213]